MKYVLVDKGDNIVSRVELDSDVGVSGADFAMRTINGAGSGNIFGHIIQFGYAPDGTGSMFLKCVDTASTKTIIYMIFCSIFSLNTFIILISTPFVRLFCA